MRRRAWISEVSEAIALILCRPSTPIAIVNSSKAASKRLRTPFESLSNDAQAKIRELMKSLDPLGKLITRARGRGPTVSTQPKRRPAGRDLRRPKPGDVLSRFYQGREIAVRVLESGYEYDGRRFRSLSAIAQAVTGAHWNGWRFFGVVRQER